MYSALITECLYLYCQINWSDQQKTLQKLTVDLTNSWRYLRAIARQETFSDSFSMEKKLKSAQTLTDASERLRVLQTIHKRISSRFQKLTLFMGMTQVQAEKQKVGTIIRLPPPLKTSAVVSLFLTLLRYSSLLLTLTDR